MLTDPIGDMLTRIRNAIQAGHEWVEVPWSKMKREIARILKECGYIQDYSVLEGKTPGQSILRLYLKYMSKKRNAIAGLQRVSKPGRRIYATKESIPIVKRGLGVCILSTSKGVMTDREARRNGIGGEVLLYVW
jgi:small subunit ribosomal protein S8